MNSKNIPLLVDEEKLVVAVKKRPFLYDTDHPNHNHRRYVLHAWKDVADEVGHEDDEKLILAVKKRPFLYDTEHPQHSHRSLVLNAWSEVAGEVGLGYEVHAVKDRWTSIRDYYRRKLRENVKIQAGQLTKRFKKWCLFDKLHFLRPHLRDIELDTSEVLPQASDHHGQTDRNDSDADRYSEEEGIHLGIVKMENTDEEDDINSNDSYRRDIIQALDSTFEPTQTPDQPPTEQVKRPRKLKAAKRKRNSHGPGNGDLAVKRQRSEWSPPPPTRASNKTSPVGLEDAPGEINPNKYFFLGLIPMVETLDYLTAMEFRHEVHGTLLRYLKQAQGNQSARQHQGLVSCSATAESTGQGGNNCTRTCNGTPLVQDNGNEERIEESESSPLGDAIS